MEKFFSPRMQGQLRHLLTSIGPVLATHGVMADAMWQVWAGLFMATLGFVASWFAPEKGEGSHKDGQ